MAYAANLILANRLLTLNAHEMATALTEMETALSSMTTHSQPQIDAAEYAEGVLASSVQLAESQGTRLVAAINAYDGKNLWGDVIKDGSAWTVDEDATAEEDQANARDVALLKDGSGAMYDYKAKRWHAFLVAVDEEVPDDAVAILFG